MRIWVKMAAGGVRAAKRQLRLQLKESLKAMSSEQKKEESQLLIDKLFKCDEYTKAKKISVYLHMPKEEVDTSRVIEDIFRSGKSCFVPRFIGDTMDMLRVHSMEDVLSLPTYKWGIQQPAADDNSRENALNCGLDLLIVPGLGFTKDGKRLGRGKGFYDGFIKRCHEAGYIPKTIALAFSVQQCSDIPTTDHDATIDQVIFPY